MLTGATHDFSTPVEAISKLPLLGERVGVRGNVAESAMSVRKHQHHRRIVPPQPNLLPREKELTKPTNDFPTEVHPEPVRPEFVERVEGWRDLKGQNRGPSR